DNLLFQTAQKVLSDPQPFSHRSERAYYWNLYAEAERIREQLATIASRGIPATGTAEILEEIASALEQGRPAKAMPNAFAEIDPRLAGQLRSALHVAQEPEDTTPSGDMPRRRTFSRRVITDAYITIRGNLRWDSAYLQHALRLAVVLFIAVTGERYLHLERGYWAPMTALLVLRPDFSTTFSRGVQRLSGTLAGAVLATLMIALLHPSAAVDIVLVIFFGFLGYLVIVLNYAVYTITVTAYVVFLLALAGMPSHNAVVDRIAATLFGGALGLLCYAIFPTWERSRVPSAIAALLQAHGRYIECLLRVVAGSATLDEADLNKLQSDVWMLRSAANTSVDRMVSEPVRPRNIDARTALGVMAASRRIGLAALSIRAGVKENAGRYPELEPLAAQFGVAFDLLASATREQRRPDAMPALRDLQEQLSPEIPMARDTDLLVDAVNTIADLLSGDAR
ncbi:MAG TPA: FUSC family protein, partial [Candidatus Baltobacteraceae bacterium]|nr:FUSC family protein [Candidatus Baltobacteraceae bacterium]